MPRHASLSLARIFAVNEPFYCRVKTTWPEAGVLGGYEYKIQPGPTFKGDIIIIRCEGRSHLCILIERDWAGNIKVCNRSNQLSNLRHGTFQIEGRLLPDSYRPIAPPPSKPTHQTFEHGPIIVTDSLLSWKNDRNGSNFGISLKWIKLTGQAPHEINRLGWINAAHPDDRERIIRTREAGIKSGELYFIDYRLHLLAGGYCELHTYSAPLIGDNGLIVGWHGAAQIKS